MHVPLTTFEKADLSFLATDQALSVEASDEHWIFDWSQNETEDYERFSMKDGSGWMARLVPLRNELLRGDLRGLTLGWLVDVANGEVADDAQEPEAPPDLAQLSAAQLALTEFLEIDCDLLTGVGPPQRQRARP